MFACVHVCLHVFVCVKDYNLVKTECTFLYLCLSISSFPACLPVYLPVSTYMSPSLPPSLLPSLLFISCSHSLTIYLPLPSHSISSPLSPSHTLYLCLPLSTNSYSISPPHSPILLHLPSFFPLPLSPSLSHSHYFSFSPFLPHPLFLCLFLPIPPLLSLLLLHSHYLLLLLRRLFPLLCVALALSISPFVPTSLPFSPPSLSPFLPLSHSL